MRTQCKFCDYVDTGLPWALGAMMAFCLFGMFMSFQQHKEWSSIRSLCIESGGVPWQAKNSGGPICLKRDAIQSMSRK